ncbi:MAG: nuclear transport factor 2 family protein [Candidatus Cloacimonetes bacterium]|nr:nuclear transport factor 2 family protein [Candidatus Cloacimonadota bacterium]
MKKSIFAICIILIVLVANLSSDDSTQISSVFKEFEQAVKEGNSQKIMNLYNSDNIMILSKEGEPQLIDRNSTASWISGNGWKNKVTFDIESIKFTSNDDRLVAYVFLHRITGVDEGNFTYILIKIDGTWRIVADIR